jgi:hypothetical protein
MKTLKDGTFAKQARNLHVLIQMVEGLEGDFNPSSHDLKLTQLHALNQAANEAIDNWHDQENVYQRAISLRKEAFDALNPLMHHVRREINICGIHGSEKEDILQIIKQIYRSKKHLAVSSDAEVEAAAKALKKTSYKGVSFHKKLDVFERLVIILENTPSYQSSFEELSSVALRNRLTDLNTHQEKTMSALLALQKARSDRDLLFHHQTTGLVSRGIRIKEYLKIHFAKNPTHLKGLAAIKLTRR